MTLTALAGSERDTIPVRRALLSVFDKTGIVELAQFLAGKGVELVSSGGTAKALKEAGLSVLDVAEVTRSPEMLDGRVKTLHPAIHGGLLAKDGNAEHAASLAEHGIAAIDLLVVNLYPFEQAARDFDDPATIIENVDIGGPAMLRAGAKNHASVAVVCDPSDYGALMEEMAETGQTSRAFRTHSAFKVFSLTARYDSMVAEWMGGQLGDAGAPQNQTFGGALASELRYGENPHQSAALYLGTEQRPGAARAEQVQGKALSYNNLNDTDAAFELVSEFDPQAAAAVAIIKHANPCGVATGSTLLEAYQEALSCDPVSAFGGIIALNRTLDEEAAAAISEIFTEVVIAPDASDEARAILATKPNLRLLLTGGLADPSAPRKMVRTIASGLLVQDADTARIGLADLKVMTKVKPTDQQLADLLFAFRVAKHVKSNAIVYARDGATVGIGAGQMSRVDSSRIAARKALDAAAHAGWAEPRTKGCVVASDAFFPFADGLLSAAEAGATAVIQPGGSMRDDKVIEAADEAGLAMVFTGIRHFRH